jgi:hypothetical protein
MLLLVVLMMVILVAERILRERWSGVRGVGGLILDRLGMGELGFESRDYVWLDA